MDHFDIAILQKEIDECIEKKVFGAAITLSSILVELTLKNALIKQAVKKDYPKNLLQKINALEFAPAIRLAEKERIITEKDGVVLNKFKDEIRNPYIHFSTIKINKKKYNSVNDLYITKKKKDEKLAFEIRTFAYNFVSYIT